MSQPVKKILAICGSTRTDSSNERILKIIANKYQSVLDVELYSMLAELPHFNPDEDKDPVHPQVKNLRDKISAADGVLICTPEYIFSPPGVLKNALEWMVSSVVFSDKPVALIVASGLGEKTFESMTLILQTLGVKFGDESRLLIQGARSKVVGGQFADEDTAKRVDILMASFLASLQ